MLFYFFSVGVVPVEHQRFSFQVELSTWHSSTRGQSAKDRWATRDFHHVQGVYQGNMSYLCVCKYISVNGHLTYFVVGGKNRLSAQRVCHSPALQWFCVAQTKHCGRISRSHCTCMWFIQTIINIYTFFLLTLSFIAAFAGQTYNSWSVRQVFERICDMSNDVVGTLSVAFSLPSNSYRR